jgi:hypothetical protein
VPIPELGRFAFPTGFVHEVISWGGITTPRGYDVLPAVRSQARYLLAFIFISIYPHIPSLIFGRTPGSRFPKNACAERRQADFGGYPVAFATFCVDGMKFALRC